MKTSPTEHRYELDAMEDFLTYDEKDLADDEMSLMESIVRSVEKYLNHDEVRKIQKAYIYAAQAHKWQKRLSGEDYITHPLRATQILLTLKPDCATIQACILHDVVEDTPVTQEDIIKEFGTEVATLCEWLVKVAKVRYQGEDAKLETLKKTFLAMASDLRVIFIKLADRIHNIQTLHFHPKEDKKRELLWRQWKSMFLFAKNYDSINFNSIWKTERSKSCIPQNTVRLLLFCVKNIYNQINTSAKGLCVLANFYNNEIWMDLLWLVE